MQGEDRNLLICIECCERKSRDTRLQIKLSKICWWQNIKMDLVLLVECAAAPRFNTNLKSETETGIFVRFPHP